MAFRCFFRRSEPENCSDFQRGFCGNAFGASVSVNAPLAAETSIARYGNSRVRREKKFIDLKDRLTDRLAALQVFLTFPRLVEQLRIEFTAKM